MLNNQHYSPSILFISDYLGAEPSHIHETKIKIRRNRNHQFLHSMNQFTMQNDVKLDKRFSLAQIRLSLKALTIQATDNHPMKKLDLESNNDFYNSF
jgi:hypothetical protein